MVTVDPAVFGVVAVFGGMIGFLLGRAARKMEEECKERDKKTRAWYMSKEGYEEYSSILHDLMESAKAVTVEEDYRKADELTAINRDAAPIRVRHADLEKCSDNSEFRSDCPACKIGVLCVQRDPETHELLSEDRCLLCAQRVILEDIGVQAT